MTFNYSDHRTYGLCNGLLLQLAYCEGVPKCEQLRQLRLMGHPFQGLLYSRTHQHPSVECRSLGDTFQELVGCAVDDDERYYEVENLRTGEKNGVCLS